MSPTQMPPAPSSTPHASRPLHVVSSHASTASSASPATTPARANVLPAASPFPANSAAATANAMHSGSTMASKNTGEAGLAEAYVSRMAAGLPRSTTMSTDATTNRAHATV